MPDVTGDYAVDATRSRLGFSVRHVLLTRVRGRFTAFSGTAHLDEVDPSRSRVELVVDAASVDTGWRARDEHLRRHGFFGAEDHPALTFTSTAVTRDGQEWTVTGELTMKGVTRSTAIGFRQTGADRDPSGRTRLTFAGGTTLERSDWGLDFATPLETGGLLVAGGVDLDLEISVVADPGPAG